jgi:hypothetical protein
MNEQAGNQIVNDHIRKCFLPETQRHLSEARQPSEGQLINAAPLPASTTEPDVLTSRILPLLVVPEDAPERTPDGDCLALVAVEGRDSQMASAIASLLDPSHTRIALIHATWLPRTIRSPLDSGGMDNPEPADLLVFSGAREALINTRNALMRLGFHVSSHLREDRNPARPIIEMCQKVNPQLLVLGLGRHGAGIGRHVLEEERIPTLFVKAR